MMTRGNLRSIGGQNGMSVGRSFNHHPRFNRFDRYGGGEDSAIAPFFLSFHEFSLHGRHLLHQNFSVVQLLPHSR